MIKLTNLSERTVNITKTLSIPPKQYITGDIEITPRVYQLITMGILQQSSVSESTSSAANTRTYITSGAQRRQKILESIKNGDIKNGVNLSSVVKKEEETKTTRNKKNKKVGDR